MFGRLLSTTCERFRKARRERLKRNRRLTCDPLEQRQLLAADTFEFYRRNPVAPVGGPIEQFAQPNIASLGDTIFVVGDDFASMSKDNGVQWTGINPRSVFTNQPGLHNRWDNNGLEGSMRLATDPIKGMVMWLGTYSTVIDFDNDGKPLWKTAENGLRLVVARNEAELEDIRLGNLGNTVIYDFANHHLGQNKGVILKNPQMQVSNSHLYMAADFVEVKEVGGIFQEFYVRSAWWRVGLDSLQAGGDIERGVTFLSSDGPVGLANGADGVMYGATNIDSLTTRVYAWDDNNLNPDIVGNFGGNRTGLDNATSYQKEIPVGNGTQIVPVWNKVQTGWVANGKVGFMWNSDPVAPPGPGPYHSRPFIRALVIDEATATIHSQPDIFSSNETYFYPVAAVNGRDDLAVMVGRYTVTNNEPVSNDIFIDDLFNPEPTGGVGYPTNPTGWERYEAARGNKPNGGRPSEIVEAGRYYGLIGDDSFENTWIAAGFTTDEVAGNDVTTPQFYWFGREQDHPPGNLRGVQFDVLEDAVQAGDIANLLYEVLNEGIANAGPFDISFYASVDDTIDPSDLLLNTVSIAGINAGLSTGVQTNTVTMPGAADSFWDLVGSGSYFIGMIIDQADDVPEYDETDNANTGIGIDFTMAFPEDFRNNDDLPNASNLGFLTGIREYDRLNNNPDGDQDWFKVTAPFDGTLTTQIDFTNADGNLQLFVRDGGGALLGQSTSSANDFETVTIPVAASTEYFIQVRGVVGAVNDYILSTDYRIVPIDNREPNNTQQAAHNLGPTPIFNQANLSVSEFDDEDFYVFTAIGSGPFSARIEFLSQFGDLDLYLYNQSGALLSSSTGLGDIATVSAQLNANEQYFLQVNGGGTDTNQYELHYQGTTPPVYTSGNTVIVTGTGQDDTFEFIPETFDPVTMTLKHTVIVNDVAFLVDITPQKYTFRGGGGVNTLIVNGTVRNDAIDASATTVKLNSYTMNLALIQNLTIDAQAGNDTVSASGSRAITAIGNAGDDLLFGGPLNDMLRGSKGNDVINGGGGNDQLRGEDDDDRIIDGAGDDLMVGGRGNDFYLFTEPTAAQLDRVEERTGEGTDTLDFSQGVSTVAVNLDNNVLAVQGVRTLRSRVAGQFVNVENAVGSAGNDVLLGNNADNALTGGEGNDRMEGRLGGDTYVFDNPLSVQLDEIREVNEAGFDTLSFIASTVPVVADLTLDNGIAVHGIRTVNMLAAGQSAFVENLIGGFANDILKGNSSPNRIDGGDGDDQMEGRAGSDVYAFRDAQTVQTDTIVESAQFGRDDLDFSGMTNPLIGVVIDLRSGGTTVATHAGRTVNMAVANTARFLENARGGAGEDLIIGNNAANVLFGNGSRDVLVGGIGGDTIDAGTAADLQEDLLIGGSVSHDLQAMKTIYDEWVRIDLDYTSRISNLRGPTGGFNGLNFLAVDTVFDDFAVDTLSGGAGGGTNNRDWFWAADEDVITDLNTFFEQVN